MASSENVQESKETEDVPNSITSPDPSALTSAPSFLNCAVCGNGKLNSRRYGAPACLGCNVFFRRAIVKSSAFICLMEKNCNITKEQRNACRYCRLQKSFKAGMRAEAVQRRVAGPRAVGPRDPVNIKYFLKSSIPGRTTFDESQNNLLQILASLQKDQCLKNIQYFSEYRRLNGIETTHLPLRATVKDVNIVLRSALHHAFEWGLHLKPFRTLSVESKKIVLSEYVFAFFLIDQAFNTAKQAKEGFLFFQNNTFLHPNYFLGMSDKLLRTIGKVDYESHEKFVSDVLHCIAKPFRILEIDEIECAALKTFLLLTPSFAKRAIYANQERYFKAINTQCMKELMEYSTNKFPERGHERFGEIILLIGSIRCGVKAIYNHTRVSDIFNFKQFDYIIRDILLL